MQIVPKEKASSFWSHQQWQKGKGGSSTGLYIRYLESIQLIILKD